MLMLIISSLNLVLNALKFHEKDKTATVTCQNQIICRNMVLNSFQELRLLTEMLTVKFFEKFDKFCNKKW